MGNGFKKIISILLILSLIVLTNVACSSKADATTKESAITENDNLEKDTSLNNKTAKDIVDDMRIGWGLGNTLDCTGNNINISDSPSKAETLWGNPKTTQRLIDDVLNQGFNVIRIPVTWMQHMGEAPDYTISASWMERVKQIVDYAYNRGAYVIINTQHEDWNYPYYDNYETASVIMNAVWSQISETFKDYDEHLIFEGQNEPRKVGTDVEWTGGDEEGWDVVNKLNQVFVDTVRMSGGNNVNRLLLVCGYAANSTVGIYHIELPANDDMIAVSVHAYEPYDFALNTSGRSDWQQDTDAIDTLMDSLKTLFIDNDIPVIITEFGALNKDNEDERTKWATYYVSEAKAIGIPCIWWDNGRFTSDGENFGLIDRVTCTWRYSKLLEALISSSL